MSNEYDNAVVIICHGNSTSSFGIMAQHLKDALSKKMNAEILWLVTANHFSKAPPLPPESHALHAPNLKSGWWRFRRQLRPYLKKARPSAIILINQVCGFLIPVIRRELPKTRIGVLIHDMYIETEDRNALVRMIFKRFYISPAITADIFLYNSNYTRSEANRLGGYPTDHPVIGCPIDISALRGCESEKGLLKQKWNLANYKGVCLNICRDDPRKNIKTFFKLAKMRPDIAFVRIGALTPWMEKWLEENDVKNVIHFSGLTFESVAEFYHCADLFVFPSFSEGLGMPPLEALACGIQAVAADIPALRENLAGVIPLIDPPDNVDGYLKVIDDVMSGKNVVNRKAATELLELFSAESFGDRVRSSLLDKIGRGNAG